MKDILVGTLHIFSTGFLGLLVGALLVEGFFLVPYWRTLASEKFFSLHKEYGPQLYKFFAPLTILATLLPVISTITTIITETQIRWAPIVAGILASSLIGIYFLYFKNANAKFAEGKISSDELAAELKAWDYWHRVRVGIGMIAFAASLIGLRCQCP